MPLGAAGAASVIGILRLHLSRASRATNSALDDSLAAVPLACGRFHVGRGPVVAQEKG